MTLGGRKIVKLPYGYVQNGSALDEVEIRAMTGVEEDILSDDKLPMVHRLNEMVLNCIERIGSVTDKAKIKEMYPKLSSEDQYALMVALRAISVKPTYDLETDCPSCGVPVSINDIDLNSLQIRPAKKDGLPIEVTLPSGRKAKVKVMLIEDSIKNAELRLQGEARMSVAVLARLTELDGKSPTLDDVRGLLFADRVRLRNLFDELEGGIENEFKVTCPQCKRTFTEMLDIARPEFFAPKGL